MNLCKQRRPRKRLLLFLMILALPAYAVEPTWDYVVIPHGSNAADFFGGGVGASADNTLTGSNTFNGPVVMGGAATISNASRVTSTTMQVSTTATSGIDVVNYQTMTNYTTGLTNTFWGYTTNLVTGATNTTLVDAKAYTDAATNAVMNLFTNPVYLSYANTTNWIQLSASSTLARVYFSWSSNAVVTTKYIDLRP